MKDNNKTDIFLFSSPFDLVKYLVSRAQKAHLKTENLGSKIFSDPPWSPQGKKIESKMCSILIYMIKDEKSAKNIGGYLRKKNCYMR